MTSPSFGVKSLLGGFEARPSAIDKSKAVSEIGIQKPAICSVPD